MAWTACAATRRGGLTMQPIQRCLPLRRFALQECRYVAPPRPFWSTATHSMRHTLILCVASLTASLSAQSFYIPSNTPTVGTANAFPFNTSDMRYQALIRATELNSTPELITGFSLAPSTSATLMYGPVTMKMAHLASPTLSTTFDNNLAAGAVTTMDVPHFVWPVTANTWMDIDLQTPFLYNGVDNVVVEFLVTARVTGSAMRRDATNQRVYLGSYTGQPIGTDGGLTAFKMRVITGDASTATFGRGCAGSNLLTPTVSFTARPSSARR